MKDRESINEHIRNALSPVCMLISLYEDKDKFEPEIYEKLINQTIKSAKRSVEMLCGLGTESFEDEEVWINIKKKYTLPEDC